MMSAPHAFPPFAPPQCQQNATTTWWWWKMAGKVTDQNKRASVPCCCGEREGWDVGVMLHEWGKFIIKKWGSDKTMRKK